MASLIKAVISLAVNPIIAKNMTHYDYALTGFYTSFNSMLLPIFNLMYGQYYTRNYFKLKTDEERDQLGSDLVVSRLVFNAFELAFILMAFVIYAKLQKIEFPVFPYVVISFSSIILNTKYVFYILRLKMKKEAKQFFLISLYHTLIGTGLAILFVVLLKLGGLGRMSATMLAALLFAIVLLPKLITKVRFNKAVVFDALKFCWPLIIAASLGYFFTGFDRALLVNLEDTVLLGLYNVALSISGYLVIFQTSLSDTFQPDIFEAVANRNKKKLIIIIGGITLLNIIPVLVFIVFAPLLINLLTAGRFTEAYGYARVLSLQNVTSGIYYSISSLIIALGYSGITLISKIIASIISIFMFRYLITNFDFYGAAWGQVLSFVVMILAIMVVVLFKRKNSGLKGINKRKK